MNNEQILKKAIEKAVDNGFVDVDKDADIDIFVKWLTASSFKRMYDLIYSHSFAKAFWGEERFEQFLSDYSKEHRFLGGKLCYPYNEGSGMRYKVATWKYHLMKMVLEKEPLKYIEKFL